MARKTYPRSADRHEITAATILRRHVQRSGQAISLPVPIEMIVEQTYELTVVYDTINEREGEMILGALDPAQRTIIMNESHQDLFDEVIGPDRFTLAHELAHWVYDADDPNQMKFEFPTNDHGRVFCRDRNAIGVSDIDRIREINANKLAAALLLPSSLVIQERSRITDLRATARSWGVSQETLSIRLDELGLP